MLLLAEEEDAAAGGGGWSLGGLGTSVDDGLSLDIVGGGGSGGSGSLKWSLERERVTL